MIEVAKMAKYLVLFNPLANNKRGEEDAHRVESVITDGEFDYKSVLEVGSFQKLIDELPADVTPVLAGGDGSINYFINDVDCDRLEREVLYFPAGSGNDFMHDVSEDGSVKYVSLNKYVKNLPWVEVNGMKKHFINGIGYGIDGYCCEVADKIRETSEKPINYTSIAIKGLLFFFKPVNATVIIDGVERKFDHAWLAPAMNGRFYGGGMNATPSQNRLDSEGKLSTMIFTGRNKLRTLMIFPSIFKGEHVKHTDVVTVLSGKKIEVTFDRPCALQIDGETVLNVTSYKAYRD